jgi:hypothetical protein
MQTIRICCYLCALVSVNGPEASGCGCPCCKGLQQQKKEANPWYVNHSFPVGQQRNQATIDTDRKQGMRSALSCWLICSVIEPLGFFKVVSMVEKKCCEPHIGLSFKFELWLVVRALEVHKPGCMSRTYYYQSYFYSSYFHFMLCM